MSVTFFYSNFVDRAYTYIIVSGSFTQPLNYFDRLKRKYICSYLTAVTGKEKKWLILNDQHTRYLLTIL